MNHDGVLFAFVHEAEALAVGPLEVLPVNAEDQNTLTSYFLYDFTLLSYFFSFPMTRMSVPHRPSTESPVHAYHISGSRRAGISPSLIPEGRVLMRKHLDGRLPQRELSP